LYYAAMGEDIDDSLAKRKSARPAHLDRLNKLAGQDRLMIAGPHPAIDSSDPGNAGFSGSLIVAEFDSLEQAKSWADTDPYVTAGVYQKVSVKPFKRVL
jgi:uncharacterized protein YciI